MSGRGAVPPQGLLGQLLRLAMPMTIGGAVHTSYQLINAFWVGRLGADAVAVVAVCFPVALVVVSLASGLSLAGSIMVAREHGAGRKEGVSHFAAQTITCIVITGALLSVLASFSAPLILHLLGDWQTTLPTTLGYLRISLAGTLFVFLSMAYQAVLRGIGETRAPLGIICASVVLNASLDPLLIFGWGPVPALGVEGAAIATLITQFVMSFAGIRLMLRPRFALGIRATVLRPRWSSLRTLVRIGVPASVEQTMQAFTVMAMVSLVAPFGNVALAAYGIVFRIFTFAIIPVFSVSMATSILVGQSAGANSADRARGVAMTAARFNLALMSLLAVVCIAAATPILQLFVPEDAAVVETGTRVMRILALSYPLSGLQMAFSGAFRGAGDTLAAMLLTLFGIWALQIPLAFCLSRFTSLGETGIWCGCVIASLLNVLIGWTYFRSGRWLVRPAPADALPRPAVA